MASEETGLESKDCMKWTLQLSINVERKSPSGGEEEERKKVSVDKKAIWTNAPETYGSS